MNTSSSTDQAARGEMARAAAQQVAHNVLLPQADVTDASGIYPQAAQEAIANAGLLGIAISTEYGGLDLAYLDQARVFVELTAGDVTSAFIASQHHACTTLLIATPHTHLRDRWLPGLADGSLHGANGFNFLNFPPERAPMKAFPAPGGWRLSGALPWVTAAHHSDILVAGAVLPDGAQLLLAVPLRAALDARNPAISVDAPMDLMALAASDTTVVRCQDFFVAEKDTLLGPGPDLLKTTFRGGSAYVPTAMTLGHARRCLALLEDAAARKGSTATEMATWLRDACDQMEADLTAALEAGDFARSPMLRGRGNALAARAAHLALIAGGGTGFRRDQTAQRLYREAGFFSVWSVSGAIIPETLTHVLTETD